MLPMKRANRELRALETEDFEPSSTIGGGAGVNQEFSPRGGGNSNMSAGFNTLTRGRRRNTG